MPGPVAVELSLNGQQFTVDGLEFEYYDARVASVSPASSIFFGDQPVIVSLSGSTGHTHSPEQSYGIDDNRVFTLFHGGVT